MFLTRAVQNNQHLLMIVDNSRRLLPSGFFCWRRGYGDITVRNRLSSGCLVVFVMLVPNRTVIWFSSRGLCCELLIQHKLNQLQLFSTVRQTGKLPITNVLPYRCVWVYRMKWAQWTISITRSMHWQIARPGLTEKDTLKEYRAPVPPRRHVWTFITTLEWGELIHISPVYHSYSRCAVAQSHKLTVQSVTHAAMHCQQPICNDPNNVPTQIQTW